MALFVAGGLLLAAIPVSQVLPADPTVLDGTRSVAALVAGALWIAGFVQLSRSGRLRAAASVAAVLAGLGVAEIALRLTIGPARGPLYRRHHAWLYEHVPAASRVLATRASGRVERVRFDVNSDGFRGPELRPRGAQERVVVYGDSFVAAPSTRQEETFVARLGEELRAAGAGDVETVNAGVVGYGPGQILRRMDADLPSLDPDLAIVCVLAENDYGDILRNRAYALDERGSLVSRPAVAWEALGQFLDEARSRPLLAVLAGDALDEVHRALHAPPRTGDPFETDRWLGACEFGWQVHLRGSAAPVADLFLDHPDEDVRVAPFLPSARYKVRLMERMLAAIAARAARHRVPLLFVVIPPAIDVCEDYDRDRVDLRRFPLYRRRNLTEPIERALDRIGAPHVDLWRPFRSAGADSLYFRGGDTHWNSAGQALAARVVAGRARALLR